MRVVLLLAGVAVVAVLAAELAVGSIVGRAAANELTEAGFEVGEVELASVGRPAVAGLALGRLRDVEVVATDVTGGSLRMERLTVTAAELDLGWGRAAADAPPATVRLRVTEEDLRTAIEARLPVDVRIVLELSPGTATLGVEPIPVRLAVDAEVSDGVLRIAPAERLPAWFASVGLDFEVPLPQELSIETVRIEEAAAVAELRIDLEEFRARLRRDDDRASR